MAIFPILAGLVAALSAGACALALGAGLPWALASYGLGGSLGLLAAAALLARRPPGAPPGASPGASPGARPRPGGGFAVLARP